ncbi:hypothetical protein Tco_0733498 [Tanacetum coccineum]
MPLLSSPSPPRHYLHLPPATPPSMYQHHKGACGFNINPKGCGWFPQSTKGALVSQSPRKGCVGFMEAPRRVHLVLIKTE